MQLCRYQLKERRLWHDPGPSDEKGRWLGYEANSSVDSALYRQRGALRSALLLARSLRRTLVLPRFWASERHSRPTTLAGLYDYAAFAAAFPDHREVSDSALPDIPHFAVPSLVKSHFSCPREAAFARRLPPPRRFHISLAESPKAPTNETAAIFAAGSVGASGKRLRQWLQPWSNERFLSFDRLYHRVRKAGDATEQAAFDGAFRAALRPASEYANLIARVTAALRAKGGFNCLHVSDADLKANGGRIFARAAQLLPPDEPTLLATADARDVRALARRHFTKPLRTRALLPPAGRVLVEDVEGRTTHGLELVEVHVCAAASAVVGNLLTPFARSVCYERDGLRGMQIARGEDEWSPCTDIYGRSAPSREAGRDVRRSYK